MSPLDSEAGYENNVFFFKYLHYNSIIDLFCSYILFINFYDTKLVYILFTLIVQGFSYFAD
jgi:hypothetical protein